MIDEALERLRDSNPVPGEVTPASVDYLLARIEADAPERPRRRLRARVATTLVPTLAVATALAVAAVAIVVLSHRRGGANTPASGPSTLRVPSRGMPGVLMVDGVTFEPRGLWTISLTQCFPCATNQRMRNWTLTSTDGGDSWSTEQAGWLNSGQFSNTRDGWATGATGVPGGRGEHAYVTHDGGRTWAVASAPAGWSVGGISVSGPMVWAIAARPGSGTLILRGSAAGDALSPVRVQPGTNDEAATVAAAGADTAYVDALRGHHVEHFVTHDGGERWQTLPRFCPIEGGDRTLTVDSPTSLWRFCWDGSAPALLGRSLDGGRTYRSYHVPAPGPQGAPERFQAVSGQIAWEMTDHGDVIRIIEGGARSKVVWWRKGSQRTAVHGVPEALTVVDAQLVYVTVVVPPAKGATGSNLVVYATNDGGRTWQAHVVPLPAEAH
jgi:hypothetical protein